MYLLLIIFSLFITPYTHMIFTFLSACFNLPFLRRFLSSAMCHEYSATSIIVFPLFTCFLSPSRVSSYQNPSQNLNFHLTTQSTNECTEPTRCPVSTCVSPCSSKLAQLRALNSVDGENDNMEISVSDKIIYYLLLLG